MLKNRNFILINFFISFILFLSGYFFTKSKSKSNQELLPQGGYQKEYPSYIGKSNLKEYAKENSFSDIMLADSILSIIQNYYVDEQRTHNEDLLEITFKSLERAFPITYQMTENYIEMSLGDKKLQISKNKKLDYEKLLEALLRVGQLIEAYHSSQFIHNLERNGQQEELVRQTGNGTFTVLSALTEALDAHSALLSSEQFKELRQGTEGTFGGLGVLVGMKDNLLTVIKPIPNSPADKAGILQYDKILAIDGRDTYGYSLEDLVQFMRGAPETKVKLSLLRDGAVSAQDIMLKREVILVESVRNQTIAWEGQKFLYISIESFSQRTSLEVKQALENHIKENGMISGVILDLRSNPGGLLDQAIKISDLFVQSGVIVSTKGRREEIELARDSWDNFSYPMVVLINSESASASEIVAGALQDHERAVVIGQPSFGKGSVQTIFELPEERALKLTIARYYTPSGKSIQNIGIVPDIWLQPVFKLKENSNLLGSYRYKSERFLLNHLSGNDAIRDDNFSLIKGYYLSKSMPDEEIEKDYELDFSLTLLKSVRKIYENESLPIEARRATNWIGLAAKDLEDLKNRWQSDVNAYLQSNFSIDWTEHNRQFSDKLDLELFSPSKESYVSGEYIEIPYKILNKTSMDIGRVSVFARGQSGINTFEKLIGKIPAKTEIKGNLKILVQPFWDLGKITFELGIANESKPMNVLFSPIVVTINEKISADFSVNAHLEDSPAGLLGETLEPFEEGVIKITIRNDSNFSARDVSVKLQNLSGDQIKISDEKKFVKFLDKNQEIEFSFSISAADIILDQFLRLGIMVESKDRIYPFKKSLIVNAKPLKGYSQISLYKNGE